MKKNSISAAIKKLQHVVLVLERSLREVKGIPVKAAKRGRPPVKAAAKKGPTVKSGKRKSFGRPPATGRFETRQDLEAFVWGRFDTPHHRIADAAGVSIATVKKILSNKPRSRRKPKPVVVRVQTAPRIAPPGLPNKPAWAVSADTYQQIRVEPASDVVQIRQTDFVEAAQ